MKINIPDQQAKKRRKPREVATDMHRMANMAAATGRPDFEERLDYLAIEWLVVRGLEVLIEQDDSGVSMQIAKGA